MKGATDCNRYLGFIGLKGLGTTAGNSKNENMESGMETRVMYNFYGFRV